MSAVTDSIARAKAGEERVAVRTVTVRVKGTVLDRLDAMAGETGLSRTGLAERLLEAAIEDAVKALREIERGA